MKLPIRVQFENEAHNYQTSINVNELSHVDYFVGQPLNLGLGPKDNIHLCINAALVVCSNTLIKDTLSYVLIYNPRTNQNLPAIYSEVHKGIVGFSSENKPYYNDRVLDVAGDVFVKDVQFLIYPTWHCHNKTHRLVIEHTMVNGIKTPHRTDK
ncbi:MAG: hypothetical protein ACJAXJ_001553 [Colwellia sp.]|jgi:hypothetical protein